jgi:hypothetical protein
MITSARKRNNTNTARHTSEKDDFEKMIGGNKTAYNSTADLLSRYSGTIIDRIIAEEPEMAQVDSTIKSELQCPNIFYPRIVSDKEETAEFLSYKAVTGKSK